MAVREDLNLLCNLNIWFYHHPAEVRRGVEVSLFLVETHVEVEIHVLVEILHLLHLLHLLASRYLRRCGPHLCGININASSSDKILENEARLNLKIGNLRGGDPLRGE